MSKNCGNRLCLLFKSQYPLLPIRARQITFPMPPFQTRLVILAIFANYAVFAAFGLLLAHIARSKFLNTIDPPTSF